MENTDKLDELTDFIKNNQKSSEAGLNKGFPAAPKMIKSKDGIIEVIEKTIITEDGRQLLL